MLSANVATDIANKKVSEIEPNIEKVIRYRASQGYFDYESDYIYDSYQISHLIDILKKAGYKLSTEKRWDRFKGFKYNIHIQW